MERQSRIKIAMRSSRDGKLYKGTGPNAVPVSNQRFPSVNLVSMATRVEEVFDEADAGRIS